MKFICNLDLAQKSRSSTFCGLGSKLSPTFDALSKEHLEVIPEEADLRSVSQLMALENTAADSASNDEQLTLNGTIDGLLEFFAD